MTPRPGAAREPDTREFAFSDADFERIRRMIHARAGISLNATKRNMVYSRIARQLRAHDFASFPDFLDAAERDPRFDQAFINALTTNLTSFMNNATRQSDSSPPTRKSNQRSENVRRRTARFSVRVPHQDDGPRRPRVPCRKLRQPGGCVWPVRSWLDHLHQRRQLPLRPSLRNRRGPAFRQGSRNERLLVIAGLHPQSRLGVRLGDVGVRAVR